MSVQMSVKSVVQLRDHMELALRYIEEGKLESAKFIIKEYRDHANDLLGQM
jgi:hypothetical protein